MSQVVWTSPLASQEIVEGPHVTLSPGVAIIRFVGESDTESHEISFVDVQAFLFTSFDACSEEHVDAYDRLLDVGVDSSFARNVLSQSRRDTAGFKHFRIFFDDSGAYDVIARSAKWL
jgi:hypothetical protein